MKTKYEQAVAEAFCYCSGYATAITDITGKANFQVILMDYILENKEDLLQIKNEMTTQEIYT
jgi:hypothetical protein